jgi:hypothetical protein
VPVGILGTAEDAKLGLIVTGPKCWKRYEICKLTSWTRKYQVPLKLS